jgi:hypothetical protein
VVAVSSAIVRVPLGCSAPLHPPEAAQEVAFVELHVKVDDLPLAIESGAALIDAIGTGDVVFDAFPPPPPPPQAASSSDNPSKAWLVVIGN